MTARAIAFEPSDRYPSVDALAADIRRCLDGKPVDARSSTIVTRTGRFLRRRARVIAILVLVLGIVSAAAYAWTRNRQAPPDPRPRGRSETSMSTAAAPLVLTFNAVSWPADTTIREIAWRGLYCALVPNAPPPVPSAVAFVVSFHADSDGQPDRDTVLLETTHPIARTGQKLDAAIAGRCGQMPSGVGFYSYRVTLDAPFLARAGVTYWFSVHARVRESTIAPPGFVYWGWNGHATGDGQSLQLVPDGSMRTLPSGREFEMR